MAIRLFAEPNQLFFDRLNHNSARFVLLGNGSIYWGDAYTVLHKDIMVANEGKAVPLMAGVLLKREGDPQWSVRNVQYFSADEGSARPMLRSNVWWRATEKMLGEFVWVDHYGDELDADV